jgi:predicted membrane protein
MNNRTVVPKTIYSKLFREYKRGQMGYAAIAIIGQSCLGSAAAMVLLMGGLEMVLKMILLFLVTIFCMAYNGAVLAQLKPMSTFNLLILSLVFNTFIILGHLI